MTEEKPGIVASWGRWVALAAAVALTAKGEYDLARMAHYGERMAILFPISLDVYAAAAFARHRRGDVFAGLLLMIGCQIAVHLVPLYITGGEHVPWALVIAVSCIPPIVAWRVHGLGTGRARVEISQPVPAPADDEDDVRDASFDPWSLAEPARDTSLPIHADASLGDPFDVPVMRQPAQEMTRHDASALPSGDVRLTHPVAINGAALMRHVGTDDASDDRPDEADVTRQPERVKTRRGPKPGKDERLAEALRLVDLEKMSARAAAHKLGLNEQAVQRYVRRHKTNGHQVEVHDG